MISKKKTPRSDDWKFEVVANKIEDAQEYFTGQGRALVDALAFVSQKGKRIILRKRFRDYLDSNRKDIFPGTAHKDVWRIVEIYHGQLVRFGVLRDAD